MPIGYPGNSITKTARAKAGGGFESAIEVAAPGALSLSAATIAHGEAFTLTGSGFGSNTETQDGNEVTRKQLWQYDTTEAFDDDTENTYVTSLTLGSQYQGSANGGTAEAPFREAELTVTDYVTRHARVANSLGGSQTPSYSPIAKFPNKITYTSYGEKLYACWWQWMPFTANAQRRIGISGATGSFDTGANTPSMAFDEGEEFQIVTAASGTYTGRIILQDADWLCLDMTGDFSVMKDEINGETIEGLTTGVTATVDTVTTWESTGAQKIFRSSESDNGEDNTIKQTKQIVTPSLGIYSTGGYAGDGTSLVRPSKYSGVYDGTAQNQVVPRTWQKVEVFADLSGATLRLGYSVAGVVEWHNELSKSLYKGDSSAPVLEKWLTDFSVNNGGGIIGSELYMSNFIARIEVGDAATYGACTLLEPQRITGSITDTSVSGVFNQGALAGLTGNYIYYITNETSDIYPRGVPLSTDGLEIT